MSVEVEDLKVVKDHIYELNTAIQLHNYGEARGKAMDLIMEVQRIEAKELAKEGN